jgi:PPOX class probable F420-dependent enzyme
LRRNLSIQELEGILLRPIVATLATYRKDGSVLLSPVWHEYHDDGFDVLTDADNVKVRHLRQDPRASLVVYEQEPPYSGLELRCSARLVTDGLVEARYRIAIRYLGETQGKAYADGVDYEEIMIRLDPAVVRAWDFSDQY